MYTFPNQRVHLPMRTAWPLPHLQTSVLSAAYLACLVQPLARLGALSMIVSLLPAWAAAAFQTACGQQSLRIDLLL